VVVSFGCSIYDLSFETVELLALCYANWMELERGLPSVFPTRLTMNGWIKLSQSPITSRNDI
jgi:hypothetical protein